MLSISVSLLNTDVCRFVRLACILVSRFGEKLKTWIVSLNMKCVISEAADQWILFY